jgi:hypothetical protein
MIAVGEDSVQIRLPNSGHHNISRGDANVVR